MPRPPTTTQRGRGWQHQQAARRLRETFQEGDLCRRCHQPMWSWQKLEAGHPPTTIPLATLIANGQRPLPDALEHATCNRRAGQLLGARSPLRRKRQLPQW